MPRRQDPLSSLTNMTLPQAEDGTTVEEIKRILEHCTNLKSIHVCDQESTTFRGDMLRHLDLSTGIPALPVGPGQVPLYNKTSVNTYSSEERQQLTLLERLYFQISALTQLQYIKLKAFVLDERVEIPSGHYADNTFPTMLSLRDVDGSGKPGYLEYLSRSTKLRQLRGSVYANTCETKVTIGWPEARWMASHWPELEVAEFFSNEDETMEPIVWLKS
ncbi:MAG: hypothetical protein J3R72DRAFT_518699 [Linnemannia gamsii]|nr:MAG: hypothetical protein J3R72DRAFT_518699 [Linnemannia gamsii]